MISFTSTGSTDKLEAFLKRMSNNQIEAALGSLGERGVSALSSATPVDSGETAGAWSYKVTRGAGGFSLVWFNGHVVNGAPIAILLQYGHGTGTGGYVAGRDYINPAIQPVMDDIANEVWKVVTA